MPTERAVARAALRRLAHDMLCEATGARAVTRLCARCGSAAHGRPVAHVASGRAPDVSLSYAPGLVAVAWSWAGAVGIDVEAVGPPGELIDRSAWTEMEAALKAGGHPRLVTLALPQGYVGTAAGTRVSWRLAGPAAPAR